MGTKQEMLKAIEELPDEANVEDALERLYLLYPEEELVRKSKATDQSAAANYDPSGRNA